MPKTNTTDNTETEVVDPSVAEDENQQGTESSTDTKPNTQQDEKAESFDDAANRIAKEAFEKATEEESSPEEEEEESDPKLEPDKEKEEGTEEEEADGTEKTDEEKEEDKGPVPYERFHEKVVKEQELNDRIKQWEPEVQNYRGIVSFLSQAGVTQQDFEQAMQVLAAMKTDPAKAKQLMQPFWDSVNTLDGSKLPPDLQEQVDGGTMDIKFAKELATLRAQSQLGKIKQQKSEETLQQERLNMFRDNAKTSLTSWIDTKRKTDPDFTEKKNGDEDGKYELWALYMQDALSKAQNVQDVIKACETCYAKVNKTVSRFIPVKKTTRQLTSKNSSAKVKEVPETMEDVIADIANQHGISVDASELRG